MSTVLERFLRYVRCNTMARPGTSTVPSSPGQHDLAVMLADELRELGLERVRVTENAYVLGTLPGNTVAPAGHRPVPSIGLLAHLDTACEASGRNVNPRIVPFDGTPIPLGAGL